MGLVLNRPTEISAAEAAPVLGAVVSADDCLWEGGPVQPASLMALADFRDPEESAAIAFGTIGFVGSDREPGDVAAVVSRVRVFAGYAGWGPGQLDGELDEEAWFVAAARADDVFCEAPARLWATVLDRQGGRLRLVARMPEDPSRN
jgi:putative transcriptional regulator